MATFVMAMLAVVVIGMLQSKNKQVEELTDKVNYLFQKHEAVVEKMNEHTDNFDSAYECFMRQATEIAAVKVKLEMHIEETSEDSRGNM